MENTTNPKPEEMITMISREQKYWEEKKDKIRLDKVNAERNHAQNIVAFDSIIALCDEKIEAEKKKKAS